jgi:alkylation response protein AidB-like acyl-CoA dehydrogenase
VDFGFTVEQQHLIERVNALVKERIAPRAAQYDAEFAMPVEDIQDLHRQGWLLANLDKRRGGLGFGLYGDDPLSFFLIDEYLAYGNPSTAHCFQVHNNGLMMIDAMASDAQMKKWLAPTIERGALIPAPAPNPTAWRRPARKKRRAVISSAAQNTTPPMRAWPSGSGSAGSRRIPIPNQSCSCCTKTRRA